MAANGQLVFTDVDKVTFKGVGNTSNAVIDTLTGKIGVGIDSPEANLHVVGNSYVSTNLELGGTLIMGTVNVEAQHSLEAVTATGNITPLTIEFTNPTTSLVASGNVEVGGDISISSNLKMNDVVFINANGERAVAVGYQAGETGQGVNTVAVGYQAGQTSQTSSATAVGNLAGQTSQSDSAVAIGGQAGQTSQGAYSVAVGQLAGASSQQGRATAVGYLAGNSTQGQDATAIGYQAGKTSQSTKAVAVGVEAGKTDQGVNAIAVGYLAGETDQGDNSIILNATGVALDSTIASSFHVKPVRGGNYAASALAYTGDGEIVEETNMHFNTAGNVTFSGTGALTLPSGTTVQQPTGVAGMIRFNSTTTRLEMYNGTVWQGLRVISYGGGVSATQSAGSGTMTTSGGYKIHAFTSSGTFTVISGGHMDILIVAGGGGGGGGANSGGGGAGGVLLARDLSISDGSYTIVVGNGGTAPYANGTNGSSSSFDAYSANGGGGGGDYWSNGLIGGNGGGAGADDRNTTRSGGGTNGSTPSGFTKYGNPGGGGINGTSSGRAGGGGGGAGGAGGQANSSNAGSGGAGIDLSAIFGTTLGESGYFASGGHGQSRQNAGTVYAGPVGGGGGNGGSRAGLPNTGGGGHGGYMSDPTNTGGGGSGIVIIRYLL